MKKVLILSAIVSVIASSKIHFIQQPGCRLFRTAQVGDTWESLSGKLKDETGHVLSLKSLLTLNVGRPKKISEGDKICVSHRKPEVLMNWAYRVLDDKDTDIIQPHEIDNVKYKNRRLQLYPESSSSDLTKSQT